VKQAEVVIDIPGARLNTVFNYTVPEYTGSESLFGKRVLVDFGGRLVEAFVVNEIPGISQAGEQLKPLVKILDREPVFDHPLLGLANWMAEYYLCGVATALKLMVPRVLKKQKDLAIIATICAQDWPKDSDPALQACRELFEKIWKNGQISKMEAAELVTPDELTRLEAEGWIVLAGTYKSGRPLKTGYVYQMADVDADHELPVLKRRAPRQAQIIEILMEQVKVDQEVLDREFAKTSIESLLHKGFINVCRQSPVLGVSQWSLNEEQMVSVKNVVKALDSGRNKEMLLFGVTGSGKTEVYIHCAQHVIQQGRCVIVLVPEIALTRQLVEVFSSRVPDLAVLHSGLSARQRYDEWNRIRSGEASLVLGARSAIFAPVPNLGLIIVDEEQESSFKQEEQPRYHAREVARQRAKAAAAVLLLGSATPSLETYFKAQQGKMQLLKLEERVGGAYMPQIVVEDMRRAFQHQSRSLIAPLLQEKIQQNLERHEQIILFINRRGYSPMTVCWECGNVGRCPECSVAMTFHRDIDRNVCHYCNRQERLPLRCVACGSQHLQLIGAGTQKVEEEIKELFPLASVARLDLDSSRRAGTQQSILQRMRDREIDILIGTQMVAKGLDFPNVALVGIIDADSILNIPDFRAGERCFQLLVQAAGRAGRSGSRGEVVIQTYSPDHPVINLAASQDYRNFYDYEIKARQLLDYPPFTHLLRIVVSSEKATQSEEYANQLVAYIEEIIDAKEEEITVLGPAPCPIAKIRNRHRFQILIKCLSMELLRSIMVHILARAGLKHVKMEWDIDPVTTI